MRRSVRSSFLGCAALLCTCAINVGAEPQLETRGRIHLSFASNSVIQSRQVGAFEPFDVYVLVEFDDPPPATTMWMLEAALRFHTGIAFGNSDWYDSGSHTLFGLSPGVLQFWESWSPCRTLQAGLTPVAHFVAVLQQEGVEAFVGIQGIDGGFGALGPGWHDCGYAGYLFESDHGTWSQLSINGGVPAGSDSWGALKALYGEEAP